MRAKLVALVALAGLLHAAPAAAQVSIWLQKGVSGFGGSVGVHVNDQATVFDLSGGYSYQGWIDFDLALKGYSFDKDSFNGATVTAGGISPGVQVHPLKQSATMPVSVGLGAGFEYTAYSSDDFGEGESITAFGLGASAAIYRFIRVGEKVGVSPAAALTVNHSTLTVASDFGETTSSNDSLGVTLAAYLAYLDDSGRVWGLVPTVAVFHTFDVPEGGDSSTTQFGVSFGVIFSRPPAD